MFDDGHHEDPLEAERTRLLWLLTRAQSIRDQAMRRVDKAEFEAQLILRRLEELK